MIHQAAIILRGVLTSSLLRKSLHLVQESDAREHTVSLASTDIEACVHLVIDTQRMLAQFAECFVGAFMLVNRMEHVAPLHFIPFICKYFFALIRPYVLPNIPTNSYLACIAAGSLASKFGASAWITWQANAHRRAMVTSRALSQIQNFKVIGLESVVSDYMLRLRSEENKYLQNPMVLSLFRMLFCKKLVNRSLVPLLTSLQRRLRGHWRL